MTKNNSHDGASQEIILHKKQHVMCDGSSIRQDATRKAQIRYIRTSGFIFNIIIFHHIVLSLPAEIGKGTRTNSLALFVSSDANPCPSTLVQFRRVHLQRIPMQPGCRDLNWRVSVDGATLALRLRGGGKEPALLPGLEDEEDEAEGEGPHAKHAYVHPKVEARRRRNRERRARIALFKEKERENHRVEGLMEVVAPGVKVLSHFKAKGGAKSEGVKPCVVSKIKSIDGEPIIKLILPSGLKQKVPVSWVHTLAPSANQTFANSSTHVPETEAYLKESKADVPQASEGERNGATGKRKKKKKSAEERMAEIRKRQRQKEKLRRMERHNRSLDEKALKEKQILEDEKAKRVLRKQERIKSKRELLAAEKENKKQKLFNNTDTAESFEQFRDIVDKMEEMGLLTDKTYDSSPLVADPEVDAYTKDPYYKGKVVKSTLILT